MNLVPNLYLGLLINLDFYLIRVGLNSPHSLFSAIGPARVRGIGQKDRKAHEARTP